MFNETSRTAKNVEYETKKLHGFAKKTTKKFKQIIGLNLLTKRNRQQTLQEFSEDLIAFINVSSVKKTDI